MSETLFGTSGIRGKINKEINPELALNLSKSFATYLENDEKQTILLGKDTRVSGEMIEESLTAGFLSAGYNVKKIGTVPTPVLGFSTKQQKANAGVMITASHNPAEYNGIKLYNSKGTALSPEKENKIEKIYRDKKYKTENWDGIGKTREEKVVNNYLNQIGKNISIEKEFDIAIDCANGPSSKTTPQLLRKLNCKAITLNSQQDGTFPSRAPEPTDENLENLSKMVSSTDIDLGFAHDGDGDRIAVIDDEGNFVNQDILLAFMGSYYAKKFGSGVVTTVDASKIVDEKVSEAGGEVSRTEVGDVHVAQEMIENDFLFGGEPSGTWILGDVHMCPDGTLAAGKILEMLSEKEEKLSSLIKNTSTYPIIRSKVDCPNEEKEPKMSKVSDKIDSEFEEIKEKITVDGVRIEFNDGAWILIRPSGTEPYIRITAEADEEKRAEDLVGRVETFLSQV